MAQIKITLTKSPIGRIPSEDNPAVRGMITAVSHLVTVEEVK